MIWLSQVLDHPLLQNPWFLVALFLGGSLLMLWRLEHMSRCGLEGTVLGTLVMPYCSGIGNLVFVFVARQEGVLGAEVVVNSLVNNVTNMTLLVGLPTLLWSTGGGRKPNRKRKEATEQRVNRLSILLTLVAVLFFTGATWALGSDGNLTFTDGLVLVGLFLFWQCFHVYDVMKTNVLTRRSLSWILALDVVLLLFGGFDVYVSVQGLVNWLPRESAGFLSYKQIGWLSGWLMVLPNAVMALYYGWRGKPEILYTSQVGDGHICIPLCVGLGALLLDVKSPPFFQQAVLVLLGAVAVHMFFVVLCGRLPRWVGGALTGLYLYFVYAGLLS